ncbi:hypothetical protein JCM10207_001752 [Rhodosporidiobolus poonsookiae]
MSAHSTSTAFDPSWPAYSQAQPLDDYYLASDPSPSQPHPAFYADEAAFPEASAGVMAPHAGGRAAFYPATDGGGLRIDGYADPAYTFAPQRSLSHGTTPSPALPALSPASSVSGSSSAYSGFLSPHQLHSANNSPEQQRTGLLPPAGIHDGSGVGHGAQAQKGGSGWFAEVQETYLQQQPPQQPLSAYTFGTSPSLQPTPSTPRRHAPSSTHLWRSPTSYSTTSSPTTSPYHRPTTPRVAGAYPSDGPRSGRRGSTGGLLPDSPSLRRSTPRRGLGTSHGSDADWIPTKSVRRQAQLSIAVPPAYRTASPSRMPPPPQPSFAPTAAPALENALDEASMREVEQLLGELGPILETGGYEQASQPPTPQAPPSQPAPPSEIPLHLRRIQLIPPPPSPPPRQRIPGGSYAYQQPSPAQPPRSAAVADVFAPTSISISGVTLAEEDLALLDTPSLGGSGGGFEPTSPVYDSRAYPTSAPAWRTTFDVPPVPQQHPHPPQEPYYPLPSPSYHHASLAVPMEPQHQPHYTAEGVPFRPSSAPRVSSASYYNMHPPSVTAAAAVSGGRRRRSSVDTAALHSYAATHGADPYGAGAGANYSYARPAAQFVQQQQHRAQQHELYRSASSSSLSASLPPSASAARPRVPPPFPTVLQPAPPPGSYAIDDEPDRPVTPPPAQRTVHIKSAATSGKAAAGSPATAAAAGEKGGEKKATPKRKRGSPAKKKQPGSMFINFSAADSKKLLNGVAPSGSTKKRFEEEAARAASASSSKAVEGEGPGFAVGAASGSS